MKLSLVILRILLVLLVLSYSISIQGQHLTISTTGGQTGTSGSSWSSTATANSVTITFTGTASIHPSVIEGHLNAGKDVLVQSGTGGSDITISNNITSTTSRNLTFKTVGNITLAAGRSITTVGGSIVLWANSDGETTNGGVFFDQGASISTSGGHIWIGGGSGTTSWNNLTVGNGYAVSGRNLIGFLTRTAAKIDWDAGVLLDETSLNSGGGNIYIAGQRNARNNYDGGAGIINYSGTAGTTINAGTGTIEIAASGNYSVGTNGFMTGLHPTQVTGGLSITSSNATAANAIGITASTLSNTHNGMFVEGNTQFLSTAATSGGGISINTSSPAGTGWSTWVQVGSLNVLSASGAISFNAGNSGLGLHPSAGTGFLYLGSKAGTSVTSSTASMILTADRIVTNTGSSINAASSGTLTVESAAASFSQTVSNSQWVFGTGLTGLRIGKESNTAAITIGSAQTIAGPISIYGGDIDINENINTTTGGAAGDILLKSSANIVLAGSKSLTTTGGDVIFWANSDGQTADGGVFFKTGSAVSTSGGHIWIGGGSGNNTWNGLTVGNGWAVSGRNPSDLGYIGGLSDWYAGVAFIQTNLSSGGGNIYIAGQRNSNSPVNVGAGVINNSGTGTLIDAGAGTVTIRGDNTAAGNGAFGIMTGLHPNGYTGRFTVKSSNSTATNAITVDGTSSAGTGDGILIENHARFLSTATTNGGAISISGTGFSGRNALSVGIGANAGTLDVLSASGSININVGIYPLLVASQGNMKLGSILNDADVGSSTANVVITSNNVSWTGSVPIRTSGTLMVTPTVGGSFAATLNSSALNYSGISGLVLGNATNTAGITIDAITPIAGPIAVYGGNIAINQNISTTNNGNIILNAETGSQLSFTGSGISLASNKSITTSGTGSVSLSGRGGNSNAGSQFGIVLGAGSSITTSGSGNITLNGIGGNGGTSKNYGVSFASGTNINISTEGGNIAITGVGNGVAGSSDNDGVNIQTATINAKAGTITIDGGVDHTGSNSESITYENAIAIGGVGQTGNIILRGNDMWSRNTGAKSIQTTGTLTIEPSGNSFSSALSFPFDNFSLNSITGLTIGKTSNTANIALGRETSIAGPINVYGGNITVDGNINTSEGNTNGDILLKGTGNIVQNASKTIITNGGDVTIWANSDVSNGGSISMLSAAAITTGGGRIVMAGGADDGSSGGVLNDGIPDGYARGVGVPGISTTGSFALNAGAGDIILRGSSSTKDGVLLSATTTGSITTTSGNIDINGFVDAGTVTSGQIQSGIRTVGGGAITLDGGTGLVNLVGNGPRHGLGFGISDVVSSDGATQTLIKSANTTSDAIKIRGTAGAGGHGVSFRGASTKLHATAALGGITVDAVAPGWTSTIYNPIEFLAVSGPINWLNSDATDGIYTNSSSIALGSKAGVTGLTTSSSNITFNLKKTFANLNLGIGTTGQVTIQGVNGTAAFGQAFNSSDFGLNANGQAMSSFTFGSPGNTEALTFNQAVTVAGPVNAYGGTIAINSNLTTTNSTTGDVLIQGSSISGTGNISLASGRSATINISSSGTYGGIISGTSAGLTKAGLGTLSLSGTNTYTGITTVSAGTLQLGRSNAIPNTALSLSAGATLALAGFNQEVATVSGTGTINSSTGTPTFTCGSSSTSANFGGVIGAGDITLVKEGTAQLVLSGVNTYTGNTIINGGTLRIGSNGSIGAGAPTKTYSGNVVINSGTFEFGSRTDHLFSGVISGSGNLSIRTDLNFRNVSLTLTGQNTYTGATTVGNTGTSAGVLKLNRSGGGAIPSTNNITISNDVGILEISSDQTLNNLTFNDGAKLIVNNGVAVTVSGSFSGTSTIDNNGTIIITGSSAFPGTSTINAMNNLTINNSSGVALNNDLTIAGTLTLSSGVFDVASKMLTVTGSITGASSSSYIKTSSTGRLKMSVANSSNKIFPVGNSSYNPLTITNNTGLADDFSVRVADEVLDGGTTGTAITDKVVNRTWHIGKTNANASPGINFTFQWNVNEELGTLADYKLSHFGNSAWALAAGTSDPVSGTTTKTMTHSGYTGTFSPFAIGSTSSVLPVTWLNFTGKKVTQGVELNWSTSSEQNTKDFQVQHSINAQQWTSVGNLPAAGNSNTVRNYRFVHEGPFKNSIQHYYRILQRDLDGKFSYSKVIRIEYPEAATDVVLYPNPTSDVLHINITERQELRLVNIQGVVVWKGVLPAGRHEIPVSNFAKGNYILQAGKGIYKVVIQ